MLEKSFGLLFFLKKSQNQNDDRYIYLKITADGKSKELSTKRKWESCKWNANKGRAYGNSESVKELNNFIDEFERTVYQAKRFLMESNKEITAQAVKDVLTGNYEKKLITIKACLIDFASSGC